MVLYVIIIKFTEEVKKQQHAMVTVLSFTTGICQSVSEMSNEMFSVESNDPKKRCLVCTEFSLSSSFPAIHL